MSLSTKPYKGTRDYYPEDKYVQNYIFDTWRRVVQRYGYQEYNAPTLEPLEIYTAKSGQELAGEQTYTFEDRGGRTVAIRPEMTPSISRMVAAKRQELAYPARLYSIANFMRYERPQRGREREFWQLNVDLFGVDNEQADIEIITMADAILKEFGAKSDDYVIKVNNRMFITDFMEKYLGLDPVKAKTAMKLLDKKDKISESDFDIQSREIVGDMADKFKTVVNSDSVDELPDELKKHQSFNLLVSVLNALKAAGVNSAKFDMTLMRGLDYYTGTVFEVFDTHPDNNRSLFGGGRYDGLVGLFGAEPISAVGMAPGNSMIENFLEARGLTPKYRSKTDAYIVVIDDQLEAANNLASQLRANGVNVEVDISARKADKQIKAAVKKAVSSLIFVGPKEAESGQYVLRGANDNSPEQKLDANQLVKELAN